MRDLVGAADLLMITLDTLRYDAAQEALRRGGLPTLAPYLPRGWERRHAPASFTYAAHHAFFAGFLPTPASPGPHPRLFAARFEGSATTAEHTFCFEEATLPEALAARGYRTVCIGGTGFFSRQNALSRVLPDLFQEACWSPELGVTCPDSPRNQVARALQALPSPGRVFLFLNVSALHQPNWFFGAETGAETGAGTGAGTGAQQRPDTLATHTAALEAVDRALPPLFEAFRRRGPTFAMVFSDHGTAYGEDGYHGHRLAHEVVWTVPYAEFML